MVKRTAQYRNYEQDYYRFVLACSEATKEKRYSDATMYAAEAYNAAKMIWNIFSDPDYLRRMNFMQRQYTRLRNLSESVVSQS